MSHGAVLPPVTPALMSSWQKQASSDPLLAPGTVIPQPSREEGVCYITLSPDFKIVIPSKTRTCGDGREREWGCVTT